MKLPAIIVSEVDRDRLVSVATAELRNVRPMHAASMLLSEIDRASIVGERSVPKGVVTLNAEVEIRDNVKKAVRRLRLVCPGQASLVRGAVSVLTPLGAVLIGLSEGDSIHWSTSTGSLQHVTVLRVLPKADA